MRKLETTRQINAACFEASQGRGGYVWIDSPLYGERIRVVQARRFKGQLQARVLHTGNWTGIHYAYVD